MNMLSIKGVLLTGAALSLVACATTSPAPASVGPSGPREIEAHQTTAAAGGATGIGINQFVQMSEQLANDFVASDAFLTLASAEEKPRIVLGDIENYSDNENIFVGDMRQKMRQIMVNTGVVRVFDAGIDDFDYILSPVLNSSTLRAGGIIERTYTLGMTVTTIEGEYIGEYSVDRVFAE